MFQKLKGKNVLLLTHENADLDSFCSAAIMHEYLKEKKIESVIGVPSHINEQALTFAIKEKIPFKISPLIEVFKAIILFDFNDFEQLGKLRNRFSSLLDGKHFEVFAFDHHSIEERAIVKGKNAFIDSESFSTTQILFSKLKKDFNKKMCFYTCLGIVEDTGHFLVSTAETFETFAHCLKKSGKKYSDVLGYAKHTAPKGERIAFLKAAKRARIHNLKGLVVVTSRLSFYQGAAATKLLEFGAHISLVAGTDKNEVTALSARVETSFKEKTGFNLMKHLMAPLQRELGGEIGGHSWAAQWKGKSSPMVVLSKCVSIIKKFPEN